MKFEVKKTNNGEYRFNLIAGNGQVVATSETYKQKAKALQTIESIRQDAGDASIEEAD